MRIVIKVGTSTLAHSTGRLNIRHVEKLCKVLSDLKNAGNEIILVSSGAIGLGAGKMGLATRPRDTDMKQAAAAVGQCELMYVYDRMFAEYNHVVAQLLLTSDDLMPGLRCDNFKQTMVRLLEHNVLPVINENDTVATEEISVGDNDTLSALVAAAIDADLLVLLSDIDGLYTADPHKNADAQLISTVPEITDDIISLAGGSGSSLGTGGMQTKLNAAMIVTSRGTDMLIANGAYPEKLYDIIMDGVNIGTRFLANPNNTRNC